MKKVALRIQTAFHLLVSLMLVVAGGSALASENFPQRPVTLVVATPPGGTADMIARFLSKHLTAKWKQPVIVENRPGAGTLIGTDHVLRSQPDGYTLLITFNEVATLSALHPQSGIDVSKDITPIAFIGALPVFVLAHPTMAPDNLQQLIETLKKNPGKFTYASNGPGSVLHLYTELFKREAGIDVLHIPYKGSLEASRAVLSGEVDLLVQLVNGNTINYVKSGRVKAYAVSSEQRLKDLPELPTMAEEGLPRYTLDSWYGLFGPKGMQQDIVDQLNRDMAAAFSDPEVIAGFQKLTMQPKPMPPKEFAEFFGDEVSRWSSLIKETGVKSND